MSKTLVVVESPAKAKTIEKFLGKNYTVLASMGHLRDLPKSQFGIDVENNFAPKYINIRGKGDIIKKLKTAAKNADKVFLASDPDREGEAIAWHLAHILNIDNNENCRIVFNEITKNAIQGAVKKPNKINHDRVDAQQARRMLDRIVGYKLSPLLWKKVRKGLSAGRVQSVTVKMICDREKEIERFISKEYWSIPVKLKEHNKGSNFEAVLTSCRGEKIEINDEATAEKIKNETGAVTVKADVSDSKQVNDMAEFIHTNYGKIDVIVNNAGISQQKLFTDITENDWDRMFDVNMKSMYLVTKAFVDDMIYKHSGTISNISSMWGVTGGSCEVHYSAAKAAVIGFTKALAKELGPSGICVNCVAPGVIETEMNSHLTKEDFDCLCEETPLERLGKPEEIAKTVRFLASENADFITGQVVNVDGGMVI